jgi:16S rRNA (adenine1518-N6/adenine1519-N6)-dimethyltransferase
MGPHPAAPDRNGPSSVRELAIAQSLTQIRTMLASRGLRPSRALGQNFLIDGNLMRKLVDAAALTPTDTVLEVGAGTGSLTEMLLERAGHVVAVEYDHGLHALLAERLSGRDRLTLLHADVLAGKSKITPQVLEAIEDAARSLGGRVCLVANLPYSVASPLLIDLLLVERAPALECFTVQKEVADRITAGPGGKRIGPLSIIMQSGAEIERIARVPAQAFWPQPSIESAMLRMTPRPDRIHLPALARVVHACFLHRRKTLRYNLETAFGAETPTRIHERTDLDTTRRPETLTVSEWEALSRVIASGDNETSATG